MRFPTELKLWKYEIERLARRSGLDFPPVMYYLVTLQEMSEVSARHGFPTTPHHWRYGQESLLWKKRFRFGLGKIYELVINTIPAYAYLLKANDVITQKSVMAHVCGHVDMFKNSAFFKPTNSSMVNAMASDALLVESFFEHIGRDRVKEFYDWALSFEFFIDPNSLYMRRIAPRKSEEERTREREGRMIPKRIQPREELPAYMDDFLNPSEWIDEERRRLQKELQAETDVERGAITPAEPTRDILGFLAEYAPFESWQRELLAMIRRHSYYFSPQIRTKLMNEGWATLWQEEIMTEAGMISSSELRQFSEELAGVQRKGGGLNPYRLGYELWRDIQFRWDTGRHGSIWEDCPYRFAADQWDEFAVYKTIGDSVGFETEEFRKSWREFSAFVVELKAGGVGFPAEIFVRGHFTSEHLIPAWLRYKKRIAWREQLIRMRSDMEPLELQSNLLARELVQTMPDVTDQERRFKARRDVYEQAGRCDLWLWTAGELFREERACEALIRFGDRWARGDAAYAPIPISTEWAEWAARFPAPLTLGAGREKIFEVRATCDDIMFLDEFFTKEFCERHKYFLYKAKNVWDYSSNTRAKRYVFDSRSFRRIKKRLLFQYTNFGLPVVRVVDANYNNNGELYLVHEHNGVDLDHWSHDGMYMKDVLQRLFRLWGNKKRVHLETIITEKEEEKEWWFTWHQASDKTTEDDRELRGTRVVFSYGLKVLSRHTGTHLENFESDQEEIDRKTLEVVTFKAPF